MTLDSKVVPVLTRLAAVGLLALAARWLYLYIFTDYRHHLAVYYIALAIVVAAFAIALWFQQTFAVVASVLLGTLGVLGVAFLLLSGGVSNPFLWAVGVALGMYSGSVGAALLHPPRVKGKH